MRAVSSFDSKRGRLLVAMDHPEGIVVGARMGLFRPVSVRHLVTHRMLTDRIPRASW